MPSIEVVAAVFYRDGQVLACRRSPGKAAAGQWEFPGGKVNSDESPEDALVREITEELGVSVTVGALLDRSVTDVDGVAIDLACYFTASSELPIQSTDHDEMLWVPLSDLNSLRWAAPDLPAVAALSSGAVTLPGDRL